MSSTHQPSPGPSQSVSGRQKGKTTSIGISAGAEDLKYQTKYKDLKRKVKDIENDNDKLHFKILQAKRNIQRMKLERAILYERLHAVPPSPPPPAHTSLPTTQQNNSHDSRQSRHEPEPEYARPAPLSSRSGAILESPIGPRALSAHSHDNMRDSSRHRAPHGMDAPSRNHSSPRSDSKPQSSSRSRHGYQPYQDSISPIPPPMHQSSPPPESSRSRRMDISELAGNQNSSHHNSRSNFPASEEYNDRRGRVDRDMDWERDRNHAREPPYTEQLSGSRPREEHPYPHPDSSARHLYPSRGGSPSPSGGMPSEGPPMSDSRTYDRSYSLRTLVHDEREEESRGRPTSFPPPSSSSPYPPPPRDWKEPRRSHDVPMDVDSRSHRTGEAAYSPPTRGYYDSEDGTDSARGFRSAGARSPAEEHNSRMEN
ncbi:hypothetical protein DL96DRAFT_1592480 [Flagelloscypha sp. PMI_526]|nr:hypothetical protein DL96DRAFT_1592480 [Flagelloscypha sp. PMI_526]